MQFGRMLFFSFLLELLRKMANNATEEISISILSDEQTENRALFISKSCFFKALFHEDSHQKFYEVFKSDDNISTLMFPMIARVIKTGSRADQTYLGNSDVDYMYEIGPNLVLTNNTKHYAKVPSELGDEFLYLRSTENKGFYQILDKNNRYVYPRVMQSKLAPIIREVKKVASKKSSSPTLSLEKSQNPQEFRDEDTVIAFKCIEWPQDIWEAFSQRNPKHIEDLMSVLKSKYCSIFVYYGCFLFSTS